MKNLLNTVITTPARRVISPWMLVLSSLAVLQACESDSSPEDQSKGVGGSYLFVSVPDFYFGTRDVGTSATQDIEIVNRGGDVYPLRSVRITGDHADEFSTDALKDVVLNPSEAIRVHVTFAPITDGRKFANLDVDFDTIVKVSDASNQNEQHFYKAKKLEAGQKYPESLVEYKHYIDGNPVTVNKRRAAIKVPVIKESEVYGTGEDFELYLAAMNAREEGDLDAAMAEIDTLILTHSTSYLADDALYLRGYIQLMDKKDYSVALHTMQNLRQRYPDTTYYDTALYSEAIALQELGQIDLARSIYEDLRYKHTGLDALGVKLPKDNMLSRLWFDRATNALDSLGATS